MSTADQQCINQCLDGHPEAFRELIGRYQAPLKSYLLGRLSDWDKAEEAAQETFVRAYFQLAKLRKRRVFFPWLIGIAIRVAKEEMATKRRRTELAKLWAEHRSASRPVCDYGLERAIAQLAEPYRQTVLLRYYGNLSCAQVAEQLDCALGTVTKRLSRAYVMLRDALRHGEPDDEVQR